MKEYNCSYTTRIGKTTFIVNVKQSETAQKPLNTVFQEICKHEVLEDCSADKSSIFTLVACSGQQTNEPLTLGVNAIITEIDKENKIITTKDSGEEGVLGDDCLIDCSQIPMIYCNYDTQDVVDITLDDLQVGDEIILTIRSSEIENLQKEDDNKAKIAVEQLQLGTQRIK